MDFLEMTKTAKDDQYKNTLNLVDKFVESNQRKRLNLISDIESDVDNLFSIGSKLFDNFDQSGDDWAAGWLLQVLKKHKPNFFKEEKFNNWFHTYSDADIDYDQLQFVIVNIIFRISKKPIVIFFIIKKIWFMFF